MVDTTLPPLEVVPRPSRRLLALVLISHLAGLAVTAGLDLAPGWRWALAALVLLSLGYQLVAGVWRRAPWSVCAARWDALGWQLTLRNGREREARLLADSYVGVGLVVLNFRVGRFRRATLVLTADALDPDLLRRLRARLRLRGRADPDDPAAA